MDKKQFQEVNLLRCDTTFGCANKTNLYWGVAISEEAGEICGVIKKLDRGMNPREFEKTRKKILSSLSNVSMQDAPIPALGNISVNQIREAKFEPGADEPTSATHLIISHWKIQKQKALASEIADITIYLDLLAQKNGIDIDEAVKEKFNQVSDEMGCPELKVI